MKKFSLYVGALLALIGASVAYSAASPGAKLQKQDRVYGGGQFGPGCFVRSSICFANARNLAVDAHAEGDGTEAAGNSTYAAPAGIDSHRSVICLGVDGNHAVIGGVIETGANAGYWYVQYFIDRGGAAATSGNRDLASPSFIDTANAPGWPAGFPTVCPPPTTGFPGAEPVYMELDEGDIAVQDAVTD